MLKNILLKLSGGIDLGYMKPGLGPNIFGWLRLILPYQKQFYKAACVHDKEGYTVGGNEFDKENADKIFFYTILSACATMRQKKWASFYFLAVEKFGKYFYNYK